MLEGTVAFTGRLASMKRADAFALVRKHGGTPREGVTRKTDVLVVGELGWPLLDDGRPSNSLAQAKSYGIPVASERQFLEWLGQSVPDEQAKTYTADQLASLSKLPNEVVDQLAMFGLIEARGGLYGFRDLAAARQVAGLLAAGIALSAITRSLNEIRKWLPDARLSNLQAVSGILRPAAGRAIEGPHRQDRPVRSRRRKAGRRRRCRCSRRPGRRRRGRHRHRRASLSPGHEAWIPRTRPRRSISAMSCAPSGRNLEAEAAYRAAIKADPGFASAWYNLADMLDDQRRTKEAIDCLKRALDADPAYVDAMFNIGLLLQRLERHAEAALWWRRYLALDGSSPWAARAKRALKYCEIQLQGSGS